MVNISIKIKILLIIILPIISLGYIFGMIGALAGLAISIILSIRLIKKNVDRIIIYIYRARRALPSELNEVREKIIILSKRKGVRIPSLYVTELALPGSFVIGKNMDNTMLIFPGRLSGILKNEEFDALLAHSIVQINNSIRKRTFAIMIASILTMSASAIRWGAVFTGFGDYNEPAPKLFGLFVMGIMAPPAAAILNKVEEKDIDLKAAMLCENPAALIMAIDQLEKNNVTGYSSLGFLCVVDPIKETFFEYLFNSHQSREKRVKKLIEGMRHI
jgi:Zn-dependent protease with chaperone function